jgi:hypothetical protein
MDSQNLIHFIFNGIFAAATAIVGWFLKSLISRIDKVEKDLAEYKLAEAERRAVVSNQSSTDTLRDISNKIDRLLDK